MPRQKLDDPTYLLRLAEKESLNLVQELLRTDPSASIESRTLSTEQYHFLLSQTVDRLRKTNRLPVKPLATDRFDAFEQPFWETLHRSGLI